MDNYTQGVAENVGNVTVAKKHDYVWIKHVQLLCKENSKHFNAKHFYCISNNCLLIRLVLKKFAQIFITPHLTYLSRFSQCVMLFSFEKYGNIFLSYVHCSFFKEWNKKLLNCGFTTSKCSKRKASIYTCIFLNISQINSKYFPGNVKTRQRQIHQVGEPFLF